MKPSPAEPMTYSPPADSATVTTGRIGFSRNPNLQPVRLEISETERELKVTAALPEFTENDIEVRAEPRRVFISGQHEKRSEDKKKGEVVYSERRSDQVFRAIDLPAEIDPDKIKATLNNGELEITLPKKEVDKKLTTEEKAA